LLQDPKEMASYVKNETSRLHDLEIKAGSGGGRIQKLLIDTKCPLEKSFRNRTV